MANTRRSILSSQARIQVPWIKVTFGDKDLGYTFGIFDKKSKTSSDVDVNGFYKSFSSSYGIKYPNYIQSLQVTKINGQINQYTLSISYPIRPFDDPNFFEKIFSSVSNTRKITFSYGDMSMPNYIYKEEEALITKITQVFSLASSVITYQVYAVSSVNLLSMGNITRMGGHKKPSDEIKEIYPKYLQNAFSMMAGNLDAFIDGSDAEVDLEAKTNISALDYLLYLVSCMTAYGSTTSNIKQDFYILTIHDDAMYDSDFADPVIIDNAELTGPYFTVTKVSKGMEHADAYELDIGYNTSTIVSNFSIEHDENYSLCFNYQEKLNDQEYVRRLGDDGKWLDVYAPMVTSQNERYITQPSDATWWSKLTQYPINASVTVQGLLRPATLMTYLRLNVIFPGGNKHISSGLYIVTKQTDVIDQNGYKTTLSLTKIGND